MNLWHTVEVDINDVTTLFILRFVFLCIFFEWLVTIILTLDLRYTVEIDIYDITTLFIFRFVFFCVFLEWLVTAILATFIT